MNRYHNFDIELLSGEPIGGRETMRARVTDSPAGGEREAEAVPVEFPPGLREDLERLDRRELTGDDLVGLGMKLGLLLLPEHARGRYRESLARLRGDEGLRIRVRADSPVLASLPWEYACVLPPDGTGPPSFLGLDRRHSIVRHEGTVPAASLPRPTRGDISVSALLADVEAPEYPPLDLQREELNLRHALEGIARARTRFFRPGTVAQLEEALDAGADVLHFSGHGAWQRQMGEKPGTVEGTGFLILATEDRKPAPLEVGQVAANLRARGVRLAVLGACQSARREGVDPWTGVAGALVREGIPAVIGMQYGIRDDNAIAFSKRFYEVLAAGKSIDSAVLEGRVAVVNRSRQDSAERDWGAPVLYLRSDENVLFPPPPGPLLLNGLLLFATVILLSLWFYAHLSPWVLAALSRLTLAVGGLGTLAGLVAVVRWAWPLVRARKDYERDPLLARVLRRRETSWVLGLLLTGSGALLAITGSCYLALDEGAPAERVVIQFIPPEGLQFARQGRLEVDRDRPVAGRPYFFPIRHQVRATVQSPGGWEVREPFRPRLGHRVELRFQSDFRKQEFRILRLLPFVGLTWSRAGGETPYRTFSVEVVVAKGGGSGTPRESKYVLRDVRSGPVYLGASNAALRAEAARRREMERDPGFEKLLAKEEQGNRAAWLSLWASEPQYLVLPEIEEADRLTIRLVNDREGKLCSEEEIRMSEIEPGTPADRPLLNTGSCIPN